MVHAVLRPTRAVTPHSSQTRLQSCGDFPSRKGISILTARFRRARSGKNTSKANDTEKISVAPAQG